MAGVVIMIKFDRSCAFCSVRNVGLCANSSDHIFENSDDEIFPDKRDGILPHGGVIFDDYSVPQEFFILKSGWVMLSSDAGDGSRQILRFVLPGEIFGIEPSATTYHSSAAEAVTASSYCAQPIETLKRLQGEDPEFAARYITLLERERLILVNSLTNIGRRDALARVAYVLMELAVRSSGHFPLITGYEYPIPLVQRLIADATGLTVIHVNRTLRRLRSENYLDFHDGKLTVLSGARLERLVDLGRGAITAMEILKAGVGQAPNNP